MAPPEPGTNPVPGHGDIPSVNVRIIATATLVATVAYILLHQVQSELIMPLQKSLLGLTWATFPIIVLAHGLRVLVAWMYGWYSVPILLPALVYVIIMRFGFAWPPIENLIAYGLVLISAPLTISVLGLFGIAAREVQNTRTWWRAILLVGILSSMINSIAVHALIPFNGTVQQAMFSLMIGIVSGVAGLAVVALGLLVVFRRPDRS